MWPGQGWGQCSHQLSAKDVHVNTCYKRPHRVATRPQAVASHLATDDTAEARRRLARQFRRHKLESQPAGTASHMIPGLQPRPLQQGPAGNGQQPLQLSSSTSPIVLDALISQLPAAGSTADAAARELLERQYQLRPHGVMPPADMFASHIDVDLQHPQLPSALSLPSMESTAKQLTKAVVQAGHWRQVQVLLQEHEPQVNTTHLCASIVCLSKLHTSEQPCHSRADATAFLQQLVSRVVLAKDLLEYRQVCNVLWASAQMPDAFRPTSDLLAELYQQAMALGSRSVHNSHTAQSTAVAEGAQRQERVLPDMLHAAQLSYSLALLQPDLPQQLIQEVAGWITSNTQELLQVITQQHDHQPVQQHQRDSGSASSSIGHLNSNANGSNVPQHLAGMRIPCRDLATLTWSLASLPVQPGAAWLSAFAGAVACKGLVAPGNCQDLSLLLWSTATFSKSAAEGSAAAHALQTAAAAVLQAMEDSSLGNWDSQSVANTLWALATLGQRPPVKWLNRMLHRVESAAATMTVQGLSMTLWALAALGVVPQSSCMAALLQSSAKQLQRFTPQGLSNVVWALAVLEHAPSKPWVSQFWQVSRSRLPQMTTEGLINCLWASAKLRVQPPQEWIGDISRLLLQQGVQGLSAQGLSNVLWAVAHIGCSGRQSQELLSRAVQQAIVVLDAQQQAQQDHQEQQMQSAGSGVSILAAASIARNLNVVEVSALMQTAALLQARGAGELLQQFAGTNVQYSGSAIGASASSMDSNSSRSRHRSNVDSSSSIDEADGLADNLLSTFSASLQQASLPLLPSAGPFELATMFHSQISISSSSKNPPGNSSSMKMSITRKWVDAWLAAAQACFNAASSRDLAQWLWCLAKKGVRPPGQWWAGFQVASFRQMAQASSQDLANMLWALGSLGLTPDPAWLQQALHEATRRQYQKQLLPQHLANIGWALAKLGHRPDRSWLVRYQEDVFTSLSGFKPQELTNVLWSLAQLNCKIEQGLLDVCLAFMTMHLPSYKANEVAVSLWAVARLKGQPHPCLMGDALQHCFSQARQLTPTGLSMLMWSVGNSATPPLNSWVAKLLIATGVRMAGFSAQELSMLAVSLARIEFRPPDVWLQCFASAAQAQMKSFGAQALANTLWALATLHYAPSEEWMTSFDEQLQHHLASCTPAHVAMILWAMSTLEWLPQQPLWQQLQEKAEMHSASYTLRSRRMLTRAVRVLEKVEDEDLMSWPALM